MVPSELQFPFLEADIDPSPYVPAKDDHREAGRAERKKLNRISGPLFTCWIPEVAHPLPDIKADPTEARLTAGMEMRSSICHPLAVR